MMTLLLRLISGLLLLGICSSVAAQATFAKVAIQSNGNPRGYWQFLPNDYHTNATQDFPVVVFFHGLGEGGNGDSDLDEVLANGPPELVNDDLQGNVFATNQVIMLAPQVTNNTWWNENHIRPFLDYLLNTYRIDRKRIYFTGLSAGSSGIHQFMNDDEHAHQVTAFLTVAVRGKVDRDLGAYLAELTPYWGLTARGDASTTLTDSANRMAGFLLGIPATDLMSIIPNDGDIHSAYFQTNPQWQRQDGVAAFTNSNPLVTIYPGNSHNTWDVTYNNSTVWNWLFSHTKPALAITVPHEGAVLPSSPVEFAAMATDANQQVLTEIAWYSDVDGFLGIGTEISASLSVGEHTIDAVVSDAGFRGDVKHLNITIDPSWVDLIFTDDFDS